MTTATTIPEAFAQHVTQRPDSTAIRDVGGDGLTWRQYGAEVERIAGGLVGLGLRRGDTMATMLTNRTEHALVEMGANHVGITTFAIYNTSSPEQIEFLLTNSGAAIVVTERQFVDRIRASGVDVRTLVLEDGDVDALTPDAGFDFEATWRAVRPDDVLCLIYTSGTTGPPKGVEHSHHNFIEMAKSIVARFPITPDDRTVSYLPTAHLADRGVLYYTNTIYGGQITMCPDPARLGEAMVEVRPTTFAAVPRVWEKLKLAVEAVLRGNPQMQAAFDADDPAVLAAVRAKLGFDQLVWAQSGSATLNSEILSFFTKIGVPTTDLWGMSEIGIATAAPISAAKPGTVGTAMPGYEFKLAPDGELLVRSDFLMLGYRKSPEKTAEAFDEDGWLRTGDIFTVDAEGYYTIIDKKKELIINSGGKNMSPANIERAVRDASRLVGPMLAHGDGRSYNVALITVEPAVAEEFGVTARAEDLWREPTVVDLVRRAVAEGNARLSRIEQIKRFKIVPTVWEPGTPVVTPTGKLKRNVLRAQYAQDIDELYAAEPASDVYEPHGREA
ncbi:fatty-acid--CoA ligase [Gordonia spumicola]|uniref:Acyl-CoA synthetase n=1 Tax=Gordonia spumicola TaxID=589161 RepID=A0A7I9V2Y6_9ACTN|nr:AMP-dependent synthetase/ligase [Gordonia spumicola]GED99586.1 fatty-acid--CoA ligase [Gordonia spumicola]